MNVNPSQHDGMLRSAHGTIDPSQASNHYSLVHSKDSHLQDSSSSASNMALNFSHDLFTTSNSSNNSHNQPTATTTASSTSASNMIMHPSITDHNSGVDLKPVLQHSSGSSFETLDSSSLMQSAVGMNMWKSTIGLNHFKNPVIAAETHSFLSQTSGTDLNSFPTWHHPHHPHHHHPHHHGNNLAHQQAAAAGMTHHLLESPHLISYPHHPSGLSLTNNQELASKGSSVGGSGGGQSSSSNEHTAGSSASSSSFVLNSMNHHAITTSQSTGSNHQSSSSSAQPIDNLSLRSHGLDHHRTVTASSYSLAMNDNQFYTTNCSRSENRSQPNVMKSSPFMVTDRVPSSVHMSTNSNNQLSYHQNAPTDHHQQHQNSNSHQVAGGSGANTSGSSSSKATGTFRCSTCNEVFPLRTAYQSHMKTHSPNKGLKAKFQCELCGHSFSQKTSLNRHMKSHTGERPFPCEICSKAFSEKERLKIHMRTHTGEKPFRCEVCGKSFSQKSTVKRHQTVHTGEKKFKCDCGKGFANRGNLIAHIKTRGANHFE